MAFTTRSGARIWYDTQGQGEPLVMVYGIGGDSRQWWEEFPALLAEKYQLVFLDNRGTGFSDKPETPWTMSDMTADILAVVDELGLGTFHLLGCSLGSIMVRHFVRERGGERLKSLSLLCPPNGIQATESDMKAALFWDPARPLIESARGSWPIVHPEAWIAENDALLVSKFEENMKAPTPARTFQYQLQAVGAVPDPNPSLNDYAWPVLVMHGDADRLVPPGNAQTLKEAVPRARLELLPGMSHNFWSHCPRESAAVLLDFLDRAS